MRLLFFIKIIVVGLLMTNLVSCQESKSNESLPKPSNLNEAVNLTEKLLKELNYEYPGLSIAIGIHDSIYYAGGYGYANVSKKEVVNSNHAFRYYSLSKSITGIALIKLIELGKLDLESYVVNYLPNLPEHYKSIKVKHLIGHTAGIRGYNKGEWLKISQGNCTKPEEAFNVFINDPLTAKPGNGDKYSSFGYVLLSGLIESVSGQSYMSFLEEYIFNPLDIQSIHLDRSNDIKSEVEYYEKWNLNRITGKLSTEVNNTCKFGAGGLVGNAEDYAKLQLAMINSEIVDEKYSKIYYSSLKNSNGDLVNYAFGLSDRKDDIGRKYNAHSGSGMGANSVFVSYPEEKLVIVILGNIESKEINNRIGDISELFLGLLNNEE